MINVTPDKLLSVGKVSRPHGIDGEIKVQVSAGYARSLEDIKRIYLRRSTHNGELQPYKIRGYRPHQGAVLLKLIKVVSRNDSEALRGCEVLIDLSDLPPLPAGEYYAHQLTEMQVWHEAGVLIGALQEVLATGSNDVYVIKKMDGSEMLLPAIESVVKQIDIVTKKIVVAVPEGLE